MCRRDQPHAGSPHATGPYTAALRFTERWGTHYAAKLTYGAAAYQCFSLDRSAYQKLLEQGVDVELEAEGSIKGVPVNGTVSGSYKRSERFRQAVTDEKTTLRKLGSETMDDAEPIAIEAVPLGELLFPHYFSHRESGAMEEDLRSRREILNRVLMEDYFPFNDTAQVRDQLRILELEVEGFESKQIGRTRDVFGHVKVRRPPDEFQDPSADGFAPDGSRLSSTIWQRQNQAGAAVTMKAGHVEPPQPTRQFVYFVAGPGTALTDLAFEIGVDLQERAAFEPKVGRGWKTAVALQTIADLPEPLGDGHDAWIPAEVAIEDATVQIRYRRSRIDWIAPLKRQEIENQIRSRFSPTSP